MGINTTKLHSTLRTCDKHTCFRIIVLEGLKNIAAEIKLFDLHKLLAGDAAVAAN